ncbi:hypothetical protein D3C74_406760 [compost metagenome]
MQLGKGLEQQALTGLRNANTGILYCKFENGQTRIPERFQLHRKADCSFFSKLHSVPYEIDKNLAQPSFVGHQKLRKRRIDLRMKLKPLFLYPRIKDFGDMGHDLAEIDCLQLNGHHPRLNFTEIKHLIQNMQQ